MSRDPNLFYYVVILLWPFVAYQIYKRAKLDKAAVLLFLIPYMFFPVPPGNDLIKLPLLPDMDKTVVPSIVALALFWLNKEKIQFFPKYGLAPVLLTLFFLSPFLTMFANQDPLYYGPRVLPALTIVDAISTTQGLVVRCYIPFIIGYSFLNTQQSHQMFVRVVLALGLIYSLLMLYEVRMSPQLHNIFYGYFPHDWRQQIRMGGFRPVVFLGHGLLVAIFAVAIAVSAFTLWRQKDEAVKSKGLLIFLYLILVIVLCKTYSALIYIVLFSGIVLLFGRVNQLRIAATVALIVLVFPFIRGNDYIPLTDVAEFFTGLDEDRGGSLVFRLRHEDSLLERAQERPWLGWGTWGRNRVYDPRTGRDLSVTDGTWIIRFGSFGWLGYIAVFGLLCYPIMALYRYAKQSKKGGEEYSPYSIALAFILMIYLIDQIPNASLNHIIFLMAGGLAGLVAKLKGQRSEDRAKAVVG